MAPLLDYPSFVNLWLLRDFVTVYESVRGTKALGLVKEQCVLEVIVVFPHLVLAVCQMDVLFVTFQLKSNTRPLRCCSLSYNKYPCDPLSVRVN